MSLIASCSLKNIKRCILLAREISVTRLPLNPTTLNTISVRHIEILRNVDLLVREPLVNEVKTQVHFRTLDQMGIETHDKTHTFNLSCDQAFKFIKLGIINKYLAAQYCHYLIHLSKTLDGELAQYYRDRSVDLALFLIRNDDNLTTLALMTLLTEVSSSSDSGCTKVCEYVLSNQNLTTKLSQSSLAKFLSSCYKYKLWTLATKLIQSVKGHELMTPFFVDDLVNGMSESAIDYNKSNCLIEKERLKKEVFQHLFELIDMFYQERIQFITKYTFVLEAALRNFDIEFTKNPKIKSPGFCTCCKMELPIYNDDSTKQINSSLKNIVHKRAEGDLLIHTKQSDLDKFERFIAGLIMEDNKPIDVVIDGLNLAYRSSSGIMYLKKKFEEDLNRTYKLRKSTTQVQVLVTTILRANLLQDYRKILVIGRSHMSKWPGLVEFFKKNNIHYYFSENYTKDDLFQLYAATFHPKTILISSDFLRDHLALLEGKERFSLERWIDTHQAWVYVKNMKIIFPTSYEKIASVDSKSGSFHIPVIDFSKLRTIADHEPPPHLNQKMITWFCGRLNLDKKKTND